MQQEVGAQVGLDPTDSQQSTLIKRWLNTAQFHIFGQVPWPFLRAPTPLVIQTVVDYTTGTVDTTQNGTTGTFSSAPSSSLGSFAGYFIQTTSSNDWYRIATHTAGATAFTIDSPGWTTTATAVTLIVRKFYYSLDATTGVDRVIQINQSVSPFHLEERTKETFDSILPNQFTTGVPRIYMMAGLSTTAGATGVWQIKIWPSPSIVCNLYVDYIQTGVNLTSDSEISLLPEKWHRTAMIEGAIYQAYRFLNDSRAGGATTLEEFLKPVVDMMKLEYFPSTNLHRVFRNIDDYSMRNEFPLPANYPNV